MKKFLALTRFKERPTTYRLVVSPALVPVCFDGSMDAREGLAAYSTKQEWYTDQMMVTEGLVLAMGPLCGDHKRMGGEPPCKVGDIIRYKQYAGQFTMLIPHLENSEEVWDEFVQYINDEDVLGIIDSGYQCIDPASIYVSGKDGGNLDGSSSIRP